MVASEAVMLASPEQAAAECRVAANLIVGGRVVAGKAGVARATALTARASARAAGAMAVTVELALAPLAVGSGMEVGMEAEAAAVAMVVATERRAVARTADNHDS